MTPVAPTAPDRLPRYIAFEGLDGCGKSTQSRLLSAALDAVHTFEPGGHAMGAAFRAALLDGDTPVHAAAETLLFAADRAQHVSEIVRPALAAGRHVVSDRSVWSSVAYQGYGRGMPIDDILRINRFAVGACFPDIVVYLRTTPRIAAGRAGRDRIERSGGAFFEAVAAGFETLASTHGWIVIEHDTVDAVAAAVRRAVDDVLGAAV